MHMQQNAPTNLYVEKAIPNLNKIRLSISTKKRADEPDMLSPLCVSCRFCFLCKERRKRQPFRHRIFSWRERPCFAPRK